MLLSWPLSCLTLFSLPFLSLPFACELFSFASSLFFNLSLAWSTSESSWFWASSFASSFFWSSAFLLSGPSKGSSFFAFSLEPFASSFASSVSLLRVDFSLVASSFALLDFLVFSPLRVFALFVSCLSASAWMFSSVLLVVLSLLPWLSIALSLIWSPSFAFLLLSSVSWFFFFRPLPPSCLLAASDFSSEIFSFLGRPLAFFSVWMSFGGAAPRAMATASLRLACGLTSLEAVGTFCDDFAGPPSALLFSWTRQGKRKGLRLQTTWPTTWVASKKDDSL